AWLPAETASTPAARSAAESEDSLFSAPRSLNDDVNWWLSNFSHTRAPVASESARDSKHGVFSTLPAMTAAACRIDSGVTRAFAAIGTAARTASPPRGRLPRAAGASALR